MTQILRKEISREVKDNVETVKNEFHEKDIVTSDEINELLDHFDDWEEAQSSGLAVDSNEELIYIDVDALSGALADYLADCDEEDKDTCRYILFKALYEKLEKWEGYTIWI